MAWPRTQGVVTHARAVLEARAPRTLLTAHVTRLTASAQESTGLPARLAKFLQGRAPTETFASVHIISANTSASYPADARRAHGSRPVRQRSCRLTSSGSPLGPLLHLLCWPVAAMTTVPISTAPGFTTAEPFPSRPPPSPLERTSVCTGSRWHFATLRQAPSFRFTARCSLSHLPRWPSGFKPWVGSQLFVSQGISFGHPRGSIPLLLISLQCARGCSLLMPLVIMAFRFGRTCGHLSMHHHGHFHRRRHLCLSSTCIVTAASASSRRVSQTPSSPQLDVHQHRRLCLSLLRIARGRLRLGLTCTISAAYPRAQPASYLCLRVGSTYATTTDCPLA